MMNADVSFVTILPLLGSTKKIAFGKKYFSYITTLSIPYIIVGDFNEIGSSNEKLGWASPSISHFSRINSIKTNLNCVDLPYVGQVFYLRK